MEFSFAILNEQGVPDKVLQKLLGHASVETTMNIYTHATQDSQASAMEQVNIMLAKGGMQNG